MCLFIHKNEKKKNQETMGQTLPLPERIPLPRSQEDRAEMEKMGFKFLVNQLQENDCEYVEYEKPKDWELVDKSTRSDLPQWYFIDQENKARIFIYGGWKGTYDNELKIQVIDQPYYLETKPKVDNQSEKISNQQEIVPEIETEFIAAQNRYYAVLEVTSGCGSSAQAYIDNAWKEMKEQWEHLPDAKRKQYPLVKKAICTDDGNMGLSSGIDKAYSTLF